MLCEAPLKTRAWARFTSRNESAKSWAEIAKEPRPAEDLQGRGFNKPKPGKSQREKNSKRKLSSLA